MVFYWTLFAIPALGALLERRRQSDERRWFDLWLFGGFWVFYNFLSYIRDHVGADWKNYEEIIARFTSLGQGLAYSDKLFGLTAWLVKSVGLGLNAVNVICSMILSGGIIALARRTPNPWLGIVASVPYLLIVLGFGYIRQAAALGLILFALNAYNDQKPFKAAVLFFVALGFHMGAFIFVPMILLMAVIERPKIGVLLMPVFVVAILYIFSNLIDRYSDTYIDAGMDSGGALIRLVMNVIPAVIMITLRDRIALPPRGKRFWLVVSWLIIALTVAYAVSPSSTAVDRVVLFMAPIQVLIFGYFPTLFRVNRSSGPVLAMIVILYSAMVQYTWLNYASNASYWLPFSSILDSGYVATSDL